MKLLPWAIFYLNKYIYILAVEMASPGNRHCANCIGALSFPLGVKRHANAPPTRYRTHDLSIASPTPLDARKSAGGE